MKNLILLFALVCSIAVQGFAQAEKTLVKSIACDKSENVTLALAGTVEVNEWESEFIRITATIETVNAGENILKRLVMVGRYNIEVSEDGSQKVISMPKLANHVAIQGVDLQEKIKYEVAVPKGATVDVKATYYSNVNQSL